MSDQTGQIADPLSRDERKQLLILACEADRVAWAHACRPRHRQPAQLAGYVLKLLAPVTALLPGRVGRWVRGANFFVRLGRQFGWLTT